MAIIQIKRSGSSGAPGESVLKNGELAYSYLDGTLNNGGDRLYIGIGDSTDGYADSVALIGGQYFTELLDHAHGTLTASSAIITDASNKIDQLLVDNLSLNGNTLTTTDTDGDLVLSANGNGVISADSKRITNVATPTSGGDAANKTYVDQQIGTSVTLNITADSSSSGTVTLADSTLEVATDENLKVLITGDQEAGVGPTLTFSLNTTSVTAGSYGSSTAIPTFTVDSEGRLTAAGTAAVSHDITLAADEGSNDTYQTGNTLTFAGGTGLTSVVADDQISFRLDSTAVTAGQYGSTTAIPVITVDEQGRLTAATTAAISTSTTIQGDTGGAQTVDNGDAITIAGGTAISTVSSATDTVTVNLDNTAVTPGTYGNDSNTPVFTVDQQGRLTSASTARIATTLDVSATGADSIGIQLLSEALDFRASGPTNALTVATNSGANSLTYSIATATSSQAGVATFNTSDFGVSSGDVTIKTGGVSNAQLENSSITINGSAYSLGGTATIGTDSVDEGSTNLYYTDARSRAAISVTDAGGDGSLGYNSGTGVLTYTGPSPAETRAHFSGGTGVTITNGDIAIGQDVGTSANVTFQTVTVDDLTIVGTQTIIQSQTLTIKDPMIHLADSNETSDAVDIGFVGHYSDDGGASKRHTGVFRDASDGQYYIYEGLIDSDLDSAIPTNNIDRNGTGFTLSTLNVGTLVGQYAGFDSDFAAKTTADLTENTNLYHTTERVQDVVGDQFVTNGSHTNISFAYDDAGDGAIDATVATATDAVLGVASFNSTDFSVSNGAVSLNALGNSGLANNSIFIGDSEVALGETITDITGLTGLTVDNIRVNGNDISSTDTNGNITLTPNGAGKTVISNLHIGDASTTAEEYIEDTIAAALSQGEGITITYTDGTGEINVAAELATTSNAGVASFDSDNFDISGAGLVTIDTIDGGTY